MLANAGAHAQTEPGTSKAIILPTGDYDLQVTSFDVSGTLKSGGGVVLSWGVRNAGSKAISKPFTDTVYLTTSKTSVRQALQLKVAVGPASLARGSGYTRYYRFVLPQIPKGTYYLYLVTDSGSDITEVSETNNTKLYGPIGISDTGDSIRMLPELDTLHVALSGGSDTSGLGTVGAPLQGLDLAISHAATYATPTTPVRVHISAGIYDSALTLPPNVRLTGSNPFDPAETVIRPSFTKAIANGSVGIRISGEDSSVRDLTIEVDPQAKALTGFSLVQINNIPATIDNVVFKGSKVSGSIGIQALELGANTSTISRCLFTGLGSGLVTTGGGPNVSRNIFEDIDGDAIVILPSATGAKAARSVPVLGDINDPSTGFNVFGNVTGFFVNNQTSEMVLAQNNAWPITDLNLLPNFLNGLVNPDPQVEPYSLQASVLVTVRDDTTHLPIYDAEVSIAPNALPPITQNEDGVYALPAVPPGNYTIQVSAPGHFDADQVFVVQQFQVITEVTVDVTADGTADKSVSDKHTGDTNGDGRIGLSELLRATQLFNAANIRCLEGTEDGYAPGNGDTISCPGYMGDYNPRNWRISLSEMLRIIQLYTIGAYHTCDGGEDGYCPGA